MHVGWITVAQDRFIFEEDHLGIEARHGSIPTNPQMSTHIRFCMKERT